MQTRFALPGVPGIEVILDARGALATDPPLPADLVSPLTVCVILGEALLRAEGVRRDGPSELLPRTVFGIDPATRRSLAARLVADLAPDLERGD